MQTYGSQQHVTAPTARPTPAPRTYTRAPAFTLTLALILALCLVMPATYAANLLTNASFESPTADGQLPTGWVAFAGRMGEHMWVAPGASLGGGYVLLINSGGTSNVGMRSEPVPAKAGDIFEASARVFAEPGNRPALYIDYWNASKQRIAAKSVTATQTNQWETLKTTLEAPPGTEWVSIILYSNASSAPGQVAWDNASLERDMSYVVSVAADRPAALYEVGETVTFVVSVRQGGQPANNAAAQWQLSMDGDTVLSTGVARVENGEARITGKLADPGFLRLQVTIHGASAAPVTAMAAAGVSPHLIAPSRPVPDDFDAFWDANKAALAAVPPVARLTPVTSGVADVDAFDVQVDSLGAPVSGYMARPAHAQPGTLPVIITLHGAGVRSAGLPTAVGWAREGALAMDINAHGILNGQPATYYTGLEGGALRQYWLRGREARDDFYFREMFLRVVRAIDFMTAQPEWDGKTVILYGTSQGGAQALAGAGLDDRVTFFVAGVTAMADLTGTLVGRPMGWPNMAAEFSRMAPAQSQGILENLQYFDGVNFAQRTKADGFFTVGFLDSTCRPTTVYAAYNALQNDKAIYNDLFAVHENTPEATRRMRDAVLGHMAKMRSLGQDR